MTMLKKTAYLLGTITGCFLTHFMFQGTLQNHIHFAGTLNEIGFTLCLMSLTFISATYTISK
jgi:uncharacterized membrane protein YccC